jgi:hypothetical protein
LETRDDLACPILEIKHSQKYYEPYEPHKKNVSEEETVSYQIDWKGIPLDKLNWLYDWKFENDKVIILICNNYHYFFMQIV